MSRRGTVAVIAGGTTAVLVTYLVVAACSVALTLYVNTDESGVPPASSLPDGVTVERDGEGCGSGGCWRELVVRPPEGQSAQEFAEDLCLDVESCEARGLLDPRRVCLWGAAEGDRVQVSLQYDRSLRVWPFRFEE